MEFDRAVLSVAISYNDEFIATTHEGVVGVYIWANNSYYSDVLFDKVPTEPGRGTAGVSRIVFIDRPTETRPEPRVVPEVQSVPTGAEVRLAASVAQGTVEMTHGPRSKWATLSQLELIKERNKPVEPPKEPEKAPFFLTTTPGLTPEFVNKEAKEEAKEEGSRFVKRADVLEVENELQRMLREASEGRKGDAVMEVEDEQDVEALFGAYYPVLLHFRKATVASVDADLNMLCMGEFDEVGKKALVNLFKFLRLGLKSQVDYEMIQALLDRTLQLYGSLIPSIPKLKPVLEDMQAVQEVGWRHMQGLIQESLCLVELFSNIQL